MVNPAVQNHLGGTHFEPLAGAIKSIDAKVEGEAVIITAKLPKDAIGKVGEAVAKAKPEDLMKMMQ
jgi:hypothetical protein